MRPVKKPWSEPALDDLMVEVAIEVKARATAARERLGSDPTEREQVLNLLSENGYSLDENQNLISLSLHAPLIAPGDLPRSSSRTN